MSLLRSPLLRSAVDAPSLAQLRRIDTRRMSVVAWVASFAVAGIAGVLAAPLTGVFGLTSDNYTYALFVAIAAAALANLRSLPVAFAAGIGIGALRSLAVGYLVPGELGPVGQWIDSVSGLSGSVPYILLFVALFIAASRSKVRIAGTQARFELPPRSLRSGSPLRRSLPWAIAAIVVAAYALGPANVVWQELIISGMATGIILLSYTVVTGIGGMVSLAQVTFAGLAALLFGRFTYQGMPILVALLLAVLICMAVGVIFALPALRLGGLSRESPEWSGRSPTPARGSAS
jgi:hypothetical protein